MKIIYIAHPIGGDVEANLFKISQIVRSLNLSYPNIVPFVPYYVDVIALKDSNPDERARGIKNGLAILGRKGAVDEIWLYGNTISAGMRQEIITAWENNIPVVCSTADLHLELETIKKNYDICEH